MRTALLLASALATATLAVQAPVPPYDLVIRGGTVVDGTGAAGFRADVGKWEMANGKWKNPETGVIAGSVLQQPA